MKFLHVSEEDIKEREKENFQEMINDMIIEIYIGSFWHLLH